MDSLGSSNLRRIVDQLDTCFKGPVDVSVLFRLKILLGDFWSGYLLSPWHISFKEDLYIPA